ncbi:MAG: DUF3037 domain-containing protein [Dehalococcoidia bacterium]|nr:DUF3037 domain-containing protein [Dehalococcoidia bacterium]
MPDRCSFDYALIRVVPHVEREEFINVGVIVFCRVLRFLGIRVNPDDARLAVLAPDAAPPEVRAYLEVFSRIAEGAAAGGPIALLPIAERFHWLVAPRSTVIQTSPVHSGLTTNPVGELERLFERMVLPLGQPETGTQQQPG